MRIYENAFPTTYEEIRTWYPVWYWEVLDMDAIWRVFGAQLNGIQSDIILMVENNFIEHADAATITRLEEFYGITHPFPRTLVERRAVLIGFVRGRGHIGRAQIIEILSIFTTGDIDVSFSRPGTIGVTVTRDFGDMFSLADIHTILDNRIPAHLSLDVIDSPQPISAYNENRFIFRALWAYEFRIINRTAKLTGPALDGGKLLDGSWLLGSTGPGIGFVNFRVKARIDNRGEIAYGYRLNGRALPREDIPLLNGKLMLDGVWPLRGLSLLLDGSWPLRAGGLTALAGMAGRKLSMGVFRFRNESVLKLHPVHFFFRFLNHTAGFSGSALDGEHPLDGFWLLESDPPGLGFTDFSVRTRVSNWIDHAYGETLDGSRGLDSMWELYADRKRIHGTMASRALAMGVYDVRNNNALGQVTLTQTSVWSLDGVAILDGARILDKLTIKEVV